jgi:hypothetical protein
MAHVAQRASARPEYLGWILTRYATQERLTEEALAQRLGLEGRDLPRLALCLRPRAAHFAIDVRQISAKFNIDPVTLAAIVRLVESTEALAAGDAGGALADAGLLMAARARKPPRPPGDGESGDHDQPRS